MMKKLIALVMVLGIGSMAAAGLTLQINGVDAGAETTVNVGDVFTVQIYSDATDMGTTAQYSGILAIPPASVDDSRSLISLSNPQATDLPENPETGWIVNPFVATFGTNATPSVTPLGAGIGFTFDVTAGAEGVATLNLISDQAGLQDSLSINIIPEPMTLGLLGLGSLFLRRRK